MKKFVDVLASNKQLLNFFFEHLEKFVIFFKSLYNLYKNFGSFLYKVVFLYKNESHFRVVFLYKVVFYCTHENLGENRSIFKKDRNWAKKIQVRKYVFSDNLAGSQFKKYDMYSASFSTFCRNGSVSIREIWHPVKTITQVYSKNSLCVHFEFVVVGTYRVRLRIYTPQEAQVSDFPSCFFKKCSQWDLLEILFL